MSRLNKAEPMLYVDTVGKYPGKYYGTPKTIWFIADHPIIRAGVRSKHELDYGNEVWNQFTPNGELFIPSGHREPLIFRDNTEMRRSISSTLSPEVYITFGKISEDGLSPFNGKIELFVKGFSGQHDEPPHGTVMLVPARSGSPDDTIYISLILEEDHLEAVCRELIARPNAALSVRLNFAAYQEEIENRMGAGRGMFRLEVDAHVPVIEAELTVTDQPNQVGAEIPLQPISPASSAPNIQMPTFAPIITRLNWTVCLLLLLVLVMLLKQPPA